MFEDRAEAGEKLARMLERYRTEEPLVLAIPRGGVEVAIAVASHLDAELSLVVTRKLPLPYNPEAGFGAIAEDGSAFIYPGADRYLSPEVIEAIRGEQVGEIERRVQVLRHGEPLPELATRTVILVDDGLAMGSTMRASIQLCRKRGAGKVVVAVPVAGERTAREIAALADAIEVVEMPPDFRAVAQVYRHWYDVSDEQVLHLMAGWRSPSGRGEDPPNGRLH